jgi:hypothetical protein
MNLEIDVFVFQGIPSLAEHFALQDPGIIKRFIKNDE